MTKESEDSMAVGTPVDSVVDKPNNQGRLSCGCVLKLGTLPCNLHAAAPKLLEQLQRAVAWLEAVDKPGASLWGSLAMHSAINKALGKESEK